MNKLLDFGRKAIFYIRVLSGYEERHIRSLRLQLQQRAQAAQKEKELANKIPEQIILSEVRRMVEEMQNVKKSLEQTETAIDDYFKPLDKEAEAVISMQFEKEKAKAEMMGAMYKQALYERAEAEAAVELNKAKMIQQNLGQSPSEPEKSQTG